MTKDELFALAEQVEDKLYPVFRGFEKTSEYHTAKVLDAFREYRVSEACFAGTTGYGYDDLGRETLEEIYARVFGCEAALVRTTFVNGTHAIACALYGTLNPGDTFFSVTGTPYDTLLTCINGDRPGTLKTYGVKYEAMELTSDGGPDYGGIEKRVAELQPAVVYLQHSRGYADRRALYVEEIGKVAEIVHRLSPDSAVVLDNCYGEFCERRHPTELGVDLMAGSLIKNPGGGLAPIGGYICGTGECVSRCAFRLSAPGLGQEVGANLGLMPALYQGFFLAPTVVASALKGAVFAANCYESLGYRVIPNGSESRHDIIQAVELGSEKAMCAFCKGIQAAAPVDSYVTPVPSSMPGYDADVIMAAGAFVQGSSIELSADGPIRPPYAVYFQGGLTWYHAKLGIMMSVQKMSEAGLLEGKI